MQGSKIAWQPLTPGGVAAFARARVLNLLTVQLVVALIAAGATLWFVASAWFPVVNSAIQQVPDGAVVRSRKLDWPGAPAMMLAENHFLALTVDLQHGGDVRSPAHINVEFGASDIRAFSLLGLIQVSYPPERRLDLSRTSLDPWWGAWSPAILAVLGLTEVAGLFLIWAVLASLYCPVAWLAGFYADRQLTLRGAWRLCGAALMPGALCMVLAIILYGLGVLDVVRLLAAGAAHIVLGWVYALAAPFWCPRHSTASEKRNPFVEASPGEIRDDKQTPTVLPPERPTPPDPSQP